MAYKKRKLSTEHRAAISRSMLGNQNARKTLEEKAKSAEEETALVCHDLTGTCAACERQETCPDFQIDAMCSRSPEAEILVERAHSPRPVDVAEMVHDTLGGIIEDCQTLRQEELDDGIIFSGDRVRAERLKMDWVRLLARLRGIGGSGAGPGSDVPLLPQGGGGERAHLIEAAQRERDSMSEGDWTRCMRLAGEAQRLTNAQKLSPRAVLERLTEISELAPNLAQLIMYDLGQAGYPPYRS
jgi:hypothetical protein